MQDTELYERLLGLKEPWRVKAVKMDVGRRVEAEVECELLKGITPGDLLPGIQKLLSELKAAGILVGLASASKNAPMALSRLGLSSAFDYVVDGGLVKQGKPHPEIFLRAASALMVEPLHALASRMRSREFNLFRALECARWRSAWNRASRRATSWSRRPRI
jgi:beta-phosphoglucomutase-like phosphatase (HAD superfamily)